MNLQTKSFKRKTGKVVDGNEMDGALIVDTEVYSGG